LLLESRKVEDKHCVRRARRQGGQRVAEPGLVRWLTTRLALRQVESQVDEAAVAAGVPQWMQQRCLPSGKERDGEQKPREAG
jgi:hypothetical protein